MLYFEAPSSVLDAHAMAGRCLKLSLHLHREEINPDDIVVHTYFIVKML
jgi:hypothetical protein